MLVCTLYNQCSPNVSEDNTVRMLVFRAHVCERKRSKGTGGGVAKCTFVKYMFSLVRVATKYCYVSKTESLCFRGNVSLFQTRFIAHPMVRDLITTYNHVDSYAFLGLIRPLRTHTHTNETKRLMSIMWCVRSPMELPPMRPRRRSRHGCAHAT